MADYKIPVQPGNLFKMPFADEGAKTIIPDESIIHGRACLSLGFPTETQLPLTEGGIAPNRLDFQGMFYMLSAFAFWQQSGGMFTYNAELNYQPPAMVFYNGALWWCEAANGPATPAGAVTPGSNEEYWVDFAQKMNAIPVGTIISYYGATAPVGYLACNGGSFSATTYPKLYALLGKATTPDLRGLFVRGYDTRNTVDPQGAARALGSVQADDFKAHNHSTTFKRDRSSGALGNAVLGDEDYYGLQPMSTTNVGGSETRPKNIALLFCIKHD